MENSTVMRILINATAFFLLASCNPVKKVLQSPAMTDKVVVEYLKANPPKTQVTYLPGKDTTIIKDTVIRDSIRLPYPVNHRYTEIRYVDRLVRDTIRIVDRSYDSLLLRKINSLEVNISQLQAANKDLRREIWTWRIVAGIAFCLMMLAVYKIFQ
jgi:hypothetical protein